jgi:hypothetical protein
MAHQPNLASPSLLLLDVLVVHHLLLRILKAKDLLEFGLKLAPPDLLLLWHRVFISSVKVITFLSFSPSITTCCCCRCCCIPRLLMLLNPKFLHRMPNSLNLWKSKKFTTKLLRPTHTDQVHDIGCKGGVSSCDKDPTGAHAKENSSHQAANMNLCSDE